jgi:hypothetical protein
MFLLLQKYKCNAILDQDTLDGTNHAPNIKTHLMEQIMLKTDFLQKRITDVPALHLT